MTYEVNMYGYPYDVTAARRWVDDYVLPGDTVVVIMGLQSTPQGCQKLPEIIAQNQDEIITTATDYAYLFDEPTADFGVPTRMPMLPDGSRHALLPVERCLIGLSPHLHELDDPRLQSAFFDSSPVYPEDDDPYSCFGNYLLRCPTLQVLLGSLPEDCAVNVLPIPLNGAASRTGRFAESNAVNVRVGVDDFICERLDSMVGWYEQDKKWTAAAHQLMLGEVASGLDRVQEVFALEGGIHLLGIGPDYDARQTQAVFSRHGVHPVRVTRYDDRVPVAQALYGKIGVEIAGNGFDAIHFGLDTTDEKRIRADIAATTAMGLLEERHGIPPDRRYGFTWQRLEGQFLGDDVLLDEAWRALETAYAEKELLDLPTANPLARENVRGRLLELLEGTP